MNDDLTFTPLTVEVVSRVKGNTSKGKRQLPMTTEAERILRLAKKINPDGEYVFMPYGRLMLTDTFNEYLKNIVSNAAFLICRAIKLGSLLAPPYTMAKT